MNVLKVEFVKKIGIVKEYKITYQEDSVFKVNVVGRAFYYDGEEIKNIPETVLDFAENWILGEL